MRGVAYATCFCMVKKGFSAVFLLINITKTQEIMTTEKTESGIRSMSIPPPASSSDVEAKDSALFVI